MPSLERRCYTCNRPEMAVDIKRWTTVKLASAENLLPEDHSQGSILFGQILWEEAKGQATSF